MPINITGTKTDIELGEILNGEPFTTAKSDKLDNIQENAQVNTPNRSPNFYI